MLFATGLLILYPEAGWAVLAGIACRLIYRRLRGPAAQGEMDVFAGGVIAGDSLTGFYKGIAANLGRFY